MDDVDTGHRIGGVDQRIDRPARHDGSSAPDDTAQLRAELEAAHARADNLETALRSSRRIGAAQGILMVRHGLTIDEAFDLLRAASQSGNRKLRDIADDVVYTGVLDPPRPD